MACRSASLGWFGLVAIAAGLACAPPLGHANAITAEYDMSVAGQLVPKAESEFEVVEEDLSVRFTTIPHTSVTVTLAELTGTPSGLPHRVEAAARYRVLNPTNRTRTVRLAFPIARGAPEEDLEAVRWAGLLKYPNRDLHVALRRGVRAEVRLNGVTIPHEYISFESLFGKERKKWAAEVAGVVGPRERYANGQYAHPPNIFEELDQFLVPLDSLRLRALSEKDFPTTRSGIFRISLLWPSESVLGPQKITIPHTSASLLADSFGPRRSANRGIFGLPEFERILREAQYERRRLFLTLIGQEYEQHARIEDWDLDVLSFLYTCLHPEDDPVGRFLTRWGLENDVVNGVTGEIIPYEQPERYLPNDWDYMRLNRRIDFLEYPISLDAGSSATVEVQYSHLMSAEPFNPARRNAVRQIYHIQYILRTSAKWKRFGPIHIRILAPEEYRIASSLPVKYSGRKDGFRQYNLDVLEGSRVVRNLLIGFDEYHPIPAPESWPALNVSLQTYWDCFRADPRGAPSRARISSAWRKRYARA